MNSVVVDGDVARIILLGRYAEGRVALVDVDRVDLVMAAGPWYFHRGPRQGYAVAKSVHLHRLVMGCVPGDGIEIDHIDRDRLNCCRSNLHVTDRAGNAQNLGVQRNSVTGIRGVSFARTRRGPNKYEAKVAVSGQVHRLGYFASAHEAEREVRQARARLMPHSDEARLSKQRPA